MTYLDVRVAILTGFTIGVLMKAGCYVEPEIDDEGNYQDTIILTLPEPALPGTKVRLRVEPL